MGDLLQMLLWHWQGGAAGTVTQKGPWAPRWGNSACNPVPLSRVFIWLLGAGKGQEGNVPGATATGPGGAKIRAASLTCLWILCLV